MSNTSVDEMLATNLHHWHWLPSQHWLINYARTSQQQQVTRHQFLILWST